VQLKAFQVKGRDMPRLDATIEITAPVEDLWKLVSDCTRYGEFMDVEKSRVIFQKGKVTRCEVSVDLPFPFGTLDGVSDAVLSVNEATGIYTRSWKLVSGDFDYNEGFWQLTRLAPERTKVRYVVLAEPDVMIPIGVLRSKQETRTRETLLKLRQRAVEIVSARKLARRPKMKAAK
jgi:ribosome-associated toxin RatA of RatAB toxin-antitoxin module